MALVKVGPDSWVRSEDVVAIHQHIEGVCYSVEPFMAPSPRCAIVLRNGAKIPGYYKASTVEERIRLAETADG